MWGPSTGMGCPEGLWGLYPWEHSEATWTWCWVTGSRWPCLSRGLGQVTPTGAFQPQLFWDDELISH